MAHSRRIRSALRLSLPLLVLAVIGLAVPAAQAVTTTTTTVSGVVTVDGAPAAGVEVLTSLPAGVDGQWPQARTDATGHYRLSNVQVVAGARTTPLRLEASPSGADSHVVAVEVPVNVPATGLVKNIALSTLDARLVASVTGIPSGTDLGSMSLEAWQPESDLFAFGPYTAGKPIEVDGLASGRYQVDLFYGDSDLYYPGASTQAQASPLTLTAGCTTSLAVNVGAGTMKVAGRDCSRAPACINAKGSAAHAAAILKHDRKVSKKDKKKLRKARKHAKHAKHSKHAKKIKKLKKKAKRATKAVRRASQAAGRATAAVAASCR